LGFLSPTASPCPLSGSMTMKMTRRSERMLGVKHLSMFRTLGLLLLIATPLQAAAAQAARAGDGKPQLVRADEGKGFHPDDGKPVAAEVMVLLASGEEGAIDPSLSHVRALKHPPFSEYKSLKLLSRLQVTLPRDQPVEIALPNRRTLVLRLVSLLHDGRAKVAVSISRANRKEYLPLLEVIASSGEPFFVAGQRFEGGTLILGIRAGDALKLSAR
jgi:hypothetical protein